MSLPEVVADHILEVEGGYTDNRADPGNWTKGKVGQGELRGTKYGISAAAYPHLDIKKLSPEAALVIYERDYWTPSGARKAWVQGDKRLALHLFDAAVNHGVGRARAWHEEAATVDEFLAKRLRFYAGLSTFDTFGRGWVRRVASVVKAAAGVDEDRTEYEQRVSRVEIEDFTLGDWWRFFTRGHVEGDFVLHAMPLTKGVGWKAYLRRDG